MILGVPFGVDKITKQWKDVAEVARGLACNCICPSCSLPLAAKHGSEREWHFSHHTANTPKDEIVDCRFSFEVSIRMMAHQLLQEGVSLHLPEHVKTVTVPKALKETIDSEVRISKRQRLVATDQIKLTVNADFHGTKVDALYEFGKKYSLIVYFVYSGRKFPFNMQFLRSSEVGAITFDIEALAAFFYSKPMANGDTLGSARTQLIGWLETSDQAKNWHYHPREEIELESREQLINNTLKALSFGGNPLCIPLDQRIDCLVVAH